MQSREGLAFSNLIPSWLICYRVEIYTCYILLFYIINKDFIVSDFNMFVKSIYIYKGSQSLHKSIPKIKTNFKTMTAKTECFLLYRLNNLIIIWFIHSVVTLQMLLKHFLDIAVKDKSEDGITLHGTV